MCLGPKHIARFSRSKGRSCATCGGRHRAAICKKNVARLPAVSADMNTVISSAIPQAEKCTPDNENTVRQGIGCRAHKQEDGPLLAKWRQPGEFCA